MAKNVFTVMTAALQLLVPTRGIPQVGQSALQELGFTGKWKIWGGGILNSGQDVTAR